MRVRCSTSKNANFTIIDFAWLQLILRDYIEDVNSSFHYGWEIVSKVTCDPSSTDIWGKTYHTISFQDWENLKMNISKIWILCGDCRFPSQFSLICKFIAVVTCSVKKKSLWCNWNQCFLLWPIGGPICPPCQCL